MLGRLRLRLQSKAEHGFAAVCRYGYHWLSIAEGVGCCFFNICQSVPDFRIVGASKKRPLQEPRRKCWPIELLGFCKVPPGASRCLRRSEPGNCQGELGWSEFSNQKRGVLPYGDCHVSKPILASRHASCLVLFTFLVPQQAALHSLRGEGHVGVEVIRIRVGMSISS